MSTLSQSIPNLLLGISQQPDSRKRPGQVKDLVNAFPDYALGLLKRPGGKFVTKLHNAPTTGKWFPILRDETEKYIACFADNRFHIWDLETGNPVPVDMGTAQGQQSGCVIANALTDSTALKTAKATTQTSLTALQTAGANLATSIAGQTPTIERLLEFEYDYSGTEIEERLKSGILLYEDGKYLVKNNGTPVAAASATLPAGYKVGTERTDEHPLLAAKGYRIFEGERTVAATSNLDELNNIYEPAYATAKTTYDNAVTAEGTAHSDWDAEFNSCAITNAQATSANAYLDGAQPEDIQTLTLNDSTFIVNTKKAVQMKSDLTFANSTDLDTHRGMVVIAIAANETKYKFTLKQDVSGTTQTYEFEITSANSGATSEDIIKALIKEFDDSVASSAAGTPSSGQFTLYGIRDPDNNPATDNDTTIELGPGFYITSANPFSLDVGGGPTERSIIGFTDTIANITLLPLRCKKGYVVKIVNAEEIDIDDMFVQFFPDDDATYGPGYWEECAEPGIKYKFNEETMPHRLQRKADGTFEFGPLPWNDRVIGDNNTNPIPSFAELGTDTISHLFFYRNRCIKKYRKKIGRAHV